MNILIILFILLILLILALIIIIILIFYDKIYDKSYDDVQNNSELMLRFDVLNKLHILSKNNDLLTIVYNKLIDIATVEQVSVFNLSSEYINRKKDDESKYAGGKYCYLDGDSVIEMRKTSERIKEIYTELQESFDEIELTYPRIELTITHELEYKNFTFAHELGHHFLNVNKMENTEIAADNYIYIIFNEMINEPLLLYIFCSHIEIFSKNENFDYANYSVTEMNAKYIDNLITDFTERYNISLS